MEKGDSLARSVLVPAVDDRVVRQRRKLLIQSDVHLPRLALEEPTASADKQSVSAASPSVLVVELDGLCIPICCAPGKDCSLILLLVFHKIANVILRAKLCQKV